MTIGCVGPRRRRLRLRRLAMTLDLGTMLSLICRRLGIRRATLRRLLETTMTDMTEGSLLPISMRHTPPLEDQEALLGLHELVRISSVLHGTTYHLLLHWHPDEYIHYSEYPVPPSYAASDHHRGGSSDRYRYGDIQPSVYSYSFSLGVDPKALLRARRTLLTIRAMLLTLASRIRITLLASAAMATLLGLHRLVAAHRQGITLLVLVVTIPATEGTKSRRLAPYIRC